MEPEFPSSGEGTQRMEANAEYCNRKVHGKRIFFRNDSHIPKTYRKPDSRSGLLSRLCPRGKRVTVGAKLAQIVSHL